MKNFALLNCITSKKGRGKMKMFKLLSALIVMALLTSCGGDNNETYIADTSVDTVSETTVISTVDTEKSVETVVTTFEEINISSAETTEASVETTTFDPAETAELNVDDLLLTTEGWVYNNGIIDDSACYFFCIFDDGTVYTMKYSLSGSDNASENVFADKLYSLDNSVWDLAEDVKAVGNLFSQMNYEMLMGDFAAIDRNSDYYVRNADEATPAVDREYYLTHYLYPLRDGKKEAVFAESDGCYILDDHAAGFLRAVNYSDVYKAWIWQLWHFSKGDYGAEFKVYTAERELYDVGVTDINYSKDYPGIVNRIVGNYSSFKIFDSGDALYSIEQVKNFIGCESAIDEFKHSGGYTFEQVYRGVPVYGGRIDLTVDSEGYPAVLMSSYVPNIDLDVTAKQSKKIVFEALDEMDVLKYDSNMELCVVQKSPENLEPTLAYCVTVTVKETVWNGAWYEEDTEKLYFFDANTGEFLREYPLSIIN